MPAVSSDDILPRIRDKRAEVERFLTGALSRKRRLPNTTIVGGGLASPFTAWLTMSFALTSPSWLKSNNLEQNIGRAQSARTRLEVLETSVTLGQLEPTQTATEFLSCVEDAAFLER